MQLTTRHCFDAGYSQKFRTSAEDEVHCPCNFTQHLDGPAVGSGPTRGRTDTEAESQRNAVRSCLDFDTLQRLYLDPNPMPDSPVTPHTYPHPHTHLYSLRHVTQFCPLTAAHRSRFLRNFHINKIFSSELGSTLLCRFLHYSQALLRPLPARPDPP